LASIILDYEYSAGSVRLKEQIVRFTVHSGFAGIARLRHLWLPSGVLNMSYIVSIPVLAIVFAAYLVMGAGGGLMLDADAYFATLASGSVFALRAGDFFTLAGLGALFLEMLKAARAGRGTIMDHMLSTAVFVGALVCFLLVDYCGTATFFLLTAMALIDVVAGFSISIFATRRDFSMTRED
jgi:hypothetical protein